jgi:hypothetical protein
VLITFVVAYLLVTIAIGLLAAFMGRRTSWSPAARCRST